MDVKACLSWIEKQRRTDETNLKYLNGNDNSIVGQRSFDKYITKLRRLATPTGKNNHGDARAQFALSVIMYTLGDKQSGRLYDKMAQHQTQHAVPKKYRNGKTKLKPYYDLRVPEKVVNGYLVSTESLHDEASKESKQRIVAWTTITEELSYREAVKAEGELCPRCHKPLGNNAFCGNCGQKVKRD
ncbi:MAG: hypothetical protein LUC25_01105 [Ruminococcus sp.]|nr:hypothetical protein [Ruminococcus sp.]